MEDETKSSRDEDLASFKKNFRRMKYLEKEFSEFKVDEKKSIENVGACEENVPVPMAYSVDSTTGFVIPNTKISCSIEVAYKDGDVKELEITREENSSVILEKNLDEEIKMTEVVEKLEKGVVRNFSEDPEIIYTDSHTEKNFDGVEEQNEKESQRAGYKVFDSSKTDFSKQNTPPRVESDCSSVNNVVNRGKDSSSLNEKEHIAIQYMDPKDGRQKGFIERVVLFFRSFCCISHK